MKAYDLSVLPENVQNKCRSGAYTVFPSFCDVHVHFREPGFSYKETIKSGSLAAARGGYTAVCTMPNLNPVPDCTLNLQKQLDIIKKDASVNVYPFGSLSVNLEGKTLSDIKALSKYVIGFSDDGKGIQSKEMMKEAMLLVKESGSIISAHCEDNSLIEGGYIHKGAYALNNSHRGICSESEWKPIERDLELCAATGCAYHVCHISCLESVNLIRQAKKSGINVTCETAPHYILLDENKLKEDGRFKMNPPLRSPKDREAVLEAVTDGTIDMIATDHAPHSAEEKSKGLEKSAFGIVGLETAFSLLYTELVKTGIISLEKLVSLMALNPRKRFNIPLGNDYTVWDLDAEYSINPAEFLSKGKSTPFEGRKAFGKCIVTVCSKNTVYNIGGTYETA